MRVSPLLAEALEVALRAARATDGAVDPRVGSATEPLGDDRDFPLDQEDGRPVRLSVRRVPGWKPGRPGPRHEHGDPSARRQPGPGRHRQAWASDRAARMPARMPARTADCGSLVSLGGDTAVAGEPPAGGWRIRVQDETALVDRLPERGSHATVGIRSGGLATSGTTARRRDHHLHHIVDPRTGRPATTPWRTVSVAAATCAEPTPPPRRPW